MPVEFALRPRIRLREAPAPARRARPRLPKFALPALAYWLVIGGLVFEFVRRHDNSAPPLEAQAALEPPVAPGPPTVREWWRPLPAPVAPPSLPIAEPPVPEPEALQASLAEPALTEPVLTEPVLTEPVLTEPVLTEPVLTEPVLTEPVRAGFPRTERSAAEAALSSPTRTLRPTLAAKPPPRAARALASAPVDVPVPALPVPTPTPTPTPKTDASPPPVVASSLPSCEAAVAAASQDVDFSGGNRAADLPAQAIAAVLENGAWLGSCAVPERTTLDVCVAIKGGRVVGVSVTSRPADAALSSCVRRRASSLQFPYSPHLDLARTRF